MWDCEGTAHCTVTASRSSSLVHGCGAPRAHWRPVGRTSDGRLGPRRSERSTAGYCATATASPVPTTSSAAGTCLRIPPTCTSQLLLSRHLDRLTW